MMKKMTRNLLFISVFLISATGMAATDQEFANKLMPYLDSHETNLASASKAEVAYCKQQGYSTAETCISAIEMLAKQQGNACGSCKTIFGKRGQVVKTRYGSDCAVC